MGGPPTIEDLLAVTRTSFLTPGQRAGGWRQAFGATAARLPAPNSLFERDELRTLALGFPLRITAAWEVLTRQVGRLAEAELAYRQHSDGGAHLAKGGLVELRRAFSTAYGELFENAVVHDQGRRLPEILWLALSREMATRVSAVLRAGDPGAAVDPTLRYAIGECLANAAHRGEAEVLARLRRQGVPELDSACTELADCMRRDLLPLVQDGPAGSADELEAYLRGRLTLPFDRFQAAASELQAALARLRQRDANFDPVLARVEPDAAATAQDRLLFSPGLLDLLGFWQHPDAPRASPDLLRLLRETGEVLTRYEVTSALRGAIYPIAEGGAAPTTRLGGRLVSLAASTRPLDFTRQGVVESAVFRFGLVYDLVEFTQILEDLRRRGRQAEEQGLGQMRRFHAQVEQIRGRHRLKFEKFLGDGAFYSARSARSTLAVAAELRLLYERLRRQGFQFDRGMRLAVNAGTYHLIPLVGVAGDRPHFEFFGHAMVELGRLTTGKTTQEVEDITDFLVASGYDIHRVLEFLEPVRHGTRLPDHARERPYAAFVAEGGDLVNQGGVATEAFLRELERESGELRMARADLWGLTWVLLPAEPDRLDAAWIGVRSLGTARLKGIDPGPLAELVAFEQPPTGAQPLPPDATLVHTLRRLTGRVAGGEEEQVPAEPVDPDICIVSALEDDASRAWYIGRYEERLDALLHAYRIPLQLEGLGDGEPFESWLFRRRREIATLYQGLSRGSSGATVPLDHLRLRDGYFTCLLSAPHRSPS